MLGHFPPSPNFSAKALRAFAQLLPPCLINIQKIVCTENKVTTAIWDGILRGIPLLPKTQTFTQCDTPMAGFWQIQLYPYFGVPVLAFSTACLSWVQSWGSPSTQHSLLNFTRPQVGKPALALSNEKLFRYHISHVLTNGYVKMLIGRRIEIVATVTTGRRINFLTPV